MQTTNSYWDIALKTANDNSRALEEMKPDKSPGSFLGNGCMDLKKIHPIDISVFQRSKQNRQQTDLNVHHQHG